MKAQLLKVGTVAGRLRVSRQRVHELLRDNRLPHAFQLEDGTWLIPESDLDKLEIAPKQGGRPKKESK